MMRNSIKNCLWLLAFVPLIVDHSVFYPETMGKNLFIESILVLVGILFTINLFYSRSFRAEIRLKINKYFKNPLFLAVLAFISIFIISTIFAVDKYSAFWGNLERAEGLVGIMFFFSFFVFSLLIFEMKDWLWFFKLSLFTTFILLFKQLLDLFGGLLRSGSFTGNPTHLAGYLLFSIASGLIVMGEDKNRFFRYFSGTVIILSVIGIFLAQTRGTILGLGLGVISVLVYCVFIGEDINYKKINLRVAASIFLGLTIVFSGFFIFTRQNDVWQNVPGLSRIASIGQGIRGDSTISRILTLQSGWESIKPSQNSWKKTLIGWGPDNFILAYGRHYNPEQYKNEKAWFDRAHNKFLDVWVMSGLFALLAYLSIWYLYFDSLRRNKKKGVSLMKVGLLFFGISFLIHLLFIFDQISTSISLFTILAFATYLRADFDPQMLKTPQFGAKSEKRVLLSAGVFIVLLTLFLGFVFFKNILPSYLQIKSFAALIKEANTVTIESRIDSVLTPFTLAQMDIRKVLLIVFNDIYDRKLDGNATELVDKALSEGEKYIERHPFDFRFLGTLANVYSNVGYKSGNIEYLKRGETLYLKMLNYVSNRPDIVYGLAINLVQQQRFLESLNFFEETFYTNPTILAGDKEKFEAVYTRLIKYFYEQKDKENFIIVANRLKTNNYEDSVLLDKILAYLDKYGFWPKVDFN